MFTHWVEHFQKRIKTDVEKNLPARITEGSSDYICIFLVVKILCTIATHAEVSLLMFFFQLSLATKFTSYDMTIEEEKGKSTYERPLDSFHIFLFSKAQIQF